MVRTSTRQRTVVWILGLALVLAIAYIVYLFTNPASPLRSEASSLTTDATTGGKTRVIESQPLLTRDGTVTSVDGNEITVDEVGGDSFTAVLGDTSVVRKPNADSLFEVVDKSELTSGKVVTVYYVQTDDGLQTQSIDIIQ